MIEIINKDILTVEHGVICHQTNCMGAAGGLAGALFRKYPEAHRQYKITVQSYADDWMPLGNADLIKVTDELYISNLYAQYDYGTECRKTEYGTLRCCFRELINGLHWRHQEKAKIYIPYGLGCGLGGGDWEVVANIIKYEFSDYQHKIYICKHF